MPETPDFDQVARDCVVNDLPPFNSSGSVFEAIGLIAKRLRQVWNARGAADADLFKEDDGEHDALTRLWIMTTIKGEDVNTSD